MANTLKLAIISVLVLFIGLAFVQSSNATTTNKDWSNWSKCVVSCGEHHGTKTKTCEVKLGGHSSCTLDQTQTENCEIDEDDVVACPTPTPTTYHYSACAENSDGFYCKDFTSETPHDSSCKVNSDCSEATPTPTPVDQCINLSGFQSTVPANMQANVDGYCSCLTGFHQVPVGDSQDFTCDPDATPTPTPVASTTPSNPGGPGDGRSDNQGCSAHDCSGNKPSSQGGQVLGASTGPTKAVLGLSATSGEESAMPLLQLFGALTSGLVGFKLFKKNA